MYSVKMNRTIILCSAYTILSTTCACKTPKVDTFSDPGSSSLSSCKTEGVPWNQLRSPWNQLRSLDRLQHVHVNLLFAVGYQVRVRCVTEYKSMQRPITVNMGMQMPGWSDIYELGTETIDRREDTEGVTASGTCAFLQA